MLTHDLYKFRWSLSTQISKRCIEYLYCSRFIILRDRYFGVVDYKLEL